MSTRVRTNVDWSGTRHDQAGVINAVDWQGRRMQKRACVCGVVNV